MAEQVNGLIIEGILKGFITKKQGNYTNHILGIHTGDTTGDFGETSSNVVEVMVADDEELVNKITVEASKFKDKKVRFNVNAFMNNGANGNKPWGFLKINFDPTSKIELVTSKLSQAS